MNAKENFKNGCFSPNRIEIDLEEVNRAEINKEERLENKRRKDLNTLLQELDEIKQSIEKAEDKQRRLAKLMGFYTGEYAQ